MAVVNENGERTLRTRATDHIAVAVGTTKGLFFLSDGIADGPYFAGAEVPTFTQVKGRYLTAVVDDRFGTTVCWSDDGGRGWYRPDKPAISFPPETGADLERVWQLHLDQSGICGTGGAPIVYAGVEPAALFGSLDGGESYELVRSLWDHPDRASWSPGRGGLCLHTIITHPDRPERILVAISAGGVYRSDDSGKSFSARNEGIEPRLLPDTLPAHGQCVHKVALDASGPDVLWLQNHFGVYRSEDAGDHWVNVGRPGEEGGLPSDFGFPVVTHPVDHETCLVFPLESDQYRAAAGGQCRVYRTTDSGKSWEPLGDGLPQMNAHLSVLRDAFTVQDSAPYALAFGTRTGQVYASIDLGESWRLFAEHLPPVLCLRILS
ncbi:MAG: WD40/YVTN/BNR-like repeat-containing protein [Acidimicrobiales bacterium]